MPPLKYRVECRDNFTERGAQRMSDLWNYTTVKRILRNRVYLGHTLLGKSRKVSVKSKKKIKVPEEEWREHQGERGEPSLPSQHLRRHRLLRLLRRSYVFRRVRLQRRAGKILVSGVQQSDLPGAAPVCAWGAYPLR